MSLGFVLLIILAVIFAEPAEETPSGGQGVEATEAASLTATPDAKTASPDPTVSTSGTASPEPDIASPEAQVIASFTTTPEPEAAPPVDPSPPGSFTLTEPADGATVVSEEVTITGTAPPGTEIHRDIKAAPDPKFNADDEGRWQYTAELDGGENTLEFFLQDAREMHLKLTVTYERFPPGSFTLTEPADGATVASEEVTITGTAPPGTEIHRDIKAAPDPKFNADDDGRWQYTAELDGGENTLEFFLQNAKEIRLKLTVTYDPSPLGTSPPTSPPTTSEETPGPSEFIPGLYRVDVTINLENQGFTCDGPNQLETLQSWICEWTDLNGDQATVDILGASTSAIRSVTATYFAYSGDTSGAAELFAYLALLPYDGASPGEAQAWVTANMGINASTTFGDARFELLASPAGARTLSIVAVGAQ